MHLRDLFTWERVWHARYQVGGTSLLAAGFAVTVALAASAGSQTPPSVAQSALLVVVSGVLNVGGVWLFSRNPGGANLTAGQIALRHLGDAGRAVVQARQRAESGFEDPDDDAARETLGHLSVQLSAIEQHLGSNLYDWVESHPDLLPIRPKSEIKSPGETPETRADHVR